MLAATATRARAEVPIPEAPARWATDRAGFLSAPALGALDERLAAYARQTSHQVLVYIDRTTGGVPIEDWAARAFKQWRVGRKGIDDGAVLFIFSDDRRLRIEVGYGLEERVPDIVASRIINDRMVPLVRAGDRDRAVTAGVDALIAAIGAPPGAQRAQGAGDTPPQAHLPWWMWIVGPIVLVLLLRFAIRHPVIASMMMMNIGSNRRDQGGWGGGGFGGGGFGGGGGFSRRGRELRRQGRFGVMVKGQQVVHGIDVRAVEAAVRAAEQRTTGEIRVALARFYFWGDVRRAAERAFVTLKMAQTEGRNGVLLYVAPRRRQFVVLGDVGIHQRVDPKFWAGVAEELAAAFRRGDRTEGLQRAIAQIGEQLAAQFPAPPGPNVNELPDEVARRR